MKILLIGEYSRLHNSLKEGLEALGHKAIIIGTGDGFKNYNVDYSIASTIISGNKFLKKINNGVYKLTGVNIENAERALRFYRLLPKLKGYDHVQLVNSDALETFPALQQWLYKKLFKQNKSVSLLVCGDDYPIVNYLLANKLKYSILSPYLLDLKLKKQFSYTLKYSTKPYKKLFEWLHERAGIIITSDIDYQIAMDGSGYKSVLIPNPVNIDKIAFKPLDINNKIVIFLGINRHSYLKKGLNFFEQALDIIRKNYAGKAEIIVTENIPYKEYIKLYDKAHILLDMVYAYDQGYNALEAMAAGKVVFTGAETEFMQHYSLTERVAVNALPDAEDIAKELCYLIENPDEIKAIGRRARAFIEKEHNYINVAGKYLASWKLN